MLCFTSALRLFKLSDYNLITLQFTSFLLSDEQYTGLVQKLHSIW